MEGDDEVGYSDRLDNGNVDMAPNSVASTIGPVRFVWTDVKVEDVAVPRTYGEGGEVDAGEKGGGA